MTDTTERDNDDSNAAAASPHECIVMRLREYNAWRRGSDEIEQPDPKEVGELI